ncbi:hypothetical protein HanRHA438_Chr06g0285331 [Helianthus annuus]|nr:hypothetical protein HanRHA438_Chr06g0285331 [Helianthus annuus]
MQVSATKLLENHLPRGTRQGAVILILARHARALAARERSSGVYRVVRQTKFRNFILFLIVRY